MASSSSSFDSSSSVYSYFSSQESSDWSSDTSSMSTPRKIRTNGLYTHTREVMDSVLQNELVGNRYEDITVQSFVQEVFGLSPQRIVEILAMALELDPTAVSTYDTVAQSEAEPKLHAPFRKIVDQLLDRLYAHFELGDRHDEFWDRQGGHSIRSNYATRKPDMLRMWKPIPDKIDYWDLVKCIIEFKNVADKTKEKMSSIPEDKPDMAEVKKATSDSLPVPVGRARGRGSRGGRRGSSRTTSGSGGDAATGKAKAHETRTRRSRSTVSEPSPFPVTSTSKHTSTESSPNSSQLPSTTDLPSIEGLGKRKRSADDTGSRGAKPSLKPNLKEVQLASYGVECLCVGNRHYVTGIYIDRWMLTLWYYDRHAILRSVPFNFREEPRFLALVMFALSQCDKHQAGFSPFFYNSLPPLLAVHPAMDNTALDSKAPETGELHLEGSLSNITFSDIQTLGIAAPGNEESDVRQPEMEELEVETAPGESPANTTAEILEGCFLMLPPTGTEKNRAPRFRVKEVLASYYGMIGRGTSVFSVQEVNNNDIVEDPLLALKMSWQWRLRTPEGETISALRKAIPDWADHLPDIKFHTTYQPEDLDLPWTRLAVKKPPIHTILPRYLHAMAAQQYKCLWEAGDIDKFKQAFLDCVECHYHAWKDGRVLHRDLSETNLMVYSADDTKKVKGIVNDWDMSSKLGEDGNVIRSAAVHRTGTAPFMACDLLSEDVEWPHYYRHDMESLFYILIWAAIHYDLEKGEQYRTGGRAHPRFEAWTTVDGLDKKSNFLSNEVGMDAVFANIGPDFKSLKTEWLVPLWTLFHDAHVNKRRLDPSADVNYDHATCGGRLTFETFMAAMKVTPRGNSVVV